MWKNRRVLVTGATGLLGSNLVAELIDRGADIVTIVRDYVPKSLYNIDFLYEHCNEVDGDIQDYTCVNRAINEYQVQTVFHLAAQTQVGIANKNPLPTFESNIRGTWNILEACRINKVDQVIVASSDKAYGESKILPYAEDTPLRGLYPYDVSKACTDMLAQSYAASYGMTIGITRCGNLFGGGDLNFNRLVPGTIRSILQGKAPIIRSDGTMVRDYFYVKEAVSAYLTLALALYLDWHPQSTNQIYNFSYNSPMSVIEVVRLISGIMDFHKSPIIKDEANNEIPKQYLDSFRAREELGWETKWTLVEAMKETVNWYRQREAFFK